MSDANLRGSLVWRHLHWPRPLDATGPMSAVAAWAADQASPRIVLETRADKTGVRYLLGMSSRNTAGTSRRLMAAIPGLQITKPSASRDAASATARLKLSTRHRALQPDAVEPITRQLHGVFASLDGEETVVLQLVLGPRRIPLAVPNQSPSSVVMPWYQIAWMGKGGTVDPEKRAALRNKVASHGFAATLRLGATAADPQRRKNLLMALFAALRLGESPGLQARFTVDSPRNLNRVSTPWRWPLRLNVAEVVALTGWPIGDDDLPGLSPIHPRQIAPALLARPGDLVIADALAPGVTGHLGSSVTDALRHTWVVGPNGTGKSTLLLHRIEQDLQANRGLVVIEPKDLVRDVLERIPEERRDDIAVLDPTDACPIGINPLQSDGRSPELVADSLLATFAALYGDGIGPRSTDILANCLNVLARHPQASLTMVGPLLTNPGFRRSLTAGVIKRDQISAGPFWAWYEHLSNEARSQAIAPLQNKLRPILRPQLNPVQNDAASRSSASQHY